MSAYRVYRGRLRDVLDRARCAAALCGRNPRWSSRARLAWVLALRPGMGGRVGPDVAAKPMPDAPYAGFETCAVPALLPPHGSAHGADPDRGESERMAGPALPANQNKLDKTPAHRLISIGFPGGNSGDLDMVGVAQLVRAPGCGPGGRGFNPRHPPHPYGRPGFPGRFFSY